MGLKLCTPVFPWLYSYWAQRGARLWAQSCVLFGLKNQCFKQNSRRILVFVVSLNKHAPGKVSLKSNCSWKGAHSTSWRPVRAIMHEENTFISNSSRKLSQTAGPSCGCLKSNSSLKMPLFLFLNHHPPSCSRLKPNSSLKMR